MCAAVILGVHGETDAFRSSGFRVRERLAAN
jgi:hypothetical protein